MIVFYRFYNRHTTNDLDAQEEAQMFIVLLANEVHVRTDRCTRTGNKTECIEIFNRS